MGHDRAKTMPRNGCAYGELRAARRDASFFNSPGYAARYHVIIGVPRSGGYEPGPPWDVPACNRNPMFEHNAMPLDLDFTGLPARMVDPVLRCRRRGCRERWPMTSTSTPDREDAAP
jgi:hypothetical protein